MPRRGSVPKRETIADPKFGDVLASKFINNLMICGRRSVAERTLYGALEAIAGQTSESPVEVFNQAVGNCRPRQEVRSRRVGGATYQVPMELRAERSQALAIRWLIQAARARSERGMEKKLAAELLDAFNKRGGAIKKREDVHRMAEANKAFAHYRW